MSSTIKTVQLCSAFLILIITNCASEPVQQSLRLYSPGEPEFTEVIVKRVHDNLTLVCELSGDTKTHRYVWNYLPLSEDVNPEPLQILPMGLSLTSMLSKPNLQLSDSGQYICSAPPFSVTKNILVQTRGPAQCARGAFWCGARCVLALYVCDGRADCRAGEDEAPALCGPLPCSGPDKLNCSEGRCISSAACCLPSDTLCRQPRCCDHHPQFYRDGIDNEYPALFEDRHAPDDYGFIQSTIYTVTACALIFMIAVVLLVSAICKMHMKRAALRHRAARGYQLEAHRYPPCYEASRLLDRQGRPSAGNSPAHAPGSPAHVSQLQSETCGDPDGAPAPAVAANNNFALTRLGAMFTSRYRQVPTQPPPDVELQNVHSASLNSSPTRNRTQTRLEHYRSPTFTDFDHYPTSENESFGRDLNYMATPVEFYRRRNFNRGLDRFLDHIERPRPLTLQLGRFQLSIPRFGRRSSTDLDRRPDTPNIAEINIDDLDFVRLNGNDTYTLNGRTIRLLGANFENYPNVGTSRPPPYNEAMRYKLYGPPPEYLSRDTLTYDNQAQSNEEMPPRYEEVGSGREIVNSCQANFNPNNASNSLETASNSVGATSVSNEATASYLDNAAGCDVINNNGNGLVETDGNCNEASGWSDSNNEASCSVGETRIRINDSEDYSDVCVNSGLEGNSGEAINVAGTSNSFENRQNDNSNVNSNVQNNDSTNTELDNSVLNISTKIIQSSENSFNNNNGNDSCPNNGNATEALNNNVSIADIIDNLPAIDGNDGALAV